MTSRHVVLIRHAKAVDRFGALPDFQRPLTDRGWADAEQIGEYLADVAAVPDRVVVSAAVRAQETWDAAAQRLPSDDIEVVVDGSLYDADVSALFDVVRQTGDEISTLALVGHNPSMEMLAHVLSGPTGEPAAIRELDAGFRTAGVAVFELTTGWGQAQRHSAALLRFAVARAPKD